MINIIDKRVEERIPAVLRLGFRPFFLLGSVYAVVAIVAWVWMFQTGQPPRLQVPALWVIAFALFVLRFGAMLLKPRVDGHPG